MSDRYSALTVALEHDIRSDDAEKLIEAIKALRGVLDVKPHVADECCYVAQTRVRSELHKVIFEAIYPKDGKWWQR